MKAIAYVRVSSEEQAREGVSLEAQASKLQAYAALHDLGPVTVFTDAGLSGRRADNRPALQLALAAIGPGDALIVYSLSRLSRSIKDAIAISEQIRAKDANLVSLSENVDTRSAAGKMIFHVLAALAQMESDQTSERTRMALAHKRSKGEYTGGEVPYGFTKRHDGTLMQDPGEQSAITTMKRLQSEKWSLREIAAHINGDLPPRSGGKWSASSIAKILTRKEPGT